MSIAYPICLPLSPATNQLDITPSSRVAVVESPFSDVAQSQSWSGQKWALNAGYPTKKRVSMEPLVSALNSLNGLEGSFLMGDTPNMISQGNVLSKTQQPRVNGAGQSGSTLLTKSWNTGAGDVACLKAGDWIQLGGRNLLLQSRLINNAAWTKTAVTAVDDSFADPLSLGNFASQLTSTGADSYVRQAFTPLGLWPHTFSFWLRKVSAGALLLNVYVGDVSYLYLLGIATAQVGQWIRYSFQFTPKRLEQHVLWLGGAASWTTGSILAVYGAMVDPIPYQQEYKESGAAAYNKAYELYKVQNDVYYDFAGNASIDIWPKLRTPPADNQVLIMTNPLGKFRLSQPVTWSIDVAKTYGVKLTAVEDRRP